MKKEFRKKVIQDRKLLSLQLVDAYSLAIYNNIFKLQCIKNAKTIMAYLDFNNEVKTDRIINTLIEQDKKVLVPISILETRDLLLSEIKNIDNEVKIGTFGIREPKEDFIRLVDRKEIDIVIVPAVAYDINGYRLGYGGGFYDRFIETLKTDVITIGIAFEMQLFNQVPKEVHDVQLNYIITENGILCPKK